jgi:hypothetical protein
MHKIGTNHASIDMSELSVHATETWAQAHEMASVGCTSAWQLPQLLTQATFQTT